MTWFGLFNVVRGLHSFVCMRKSHFDMVGWLCGLWRRKLKSCIVLNFLSILLFSNKKKKEEKREGKKLKKKEK